MLNLFSMHPTNRIRTGLPKLHQDNQSGNWEVAKPISYFTTRLDVPECQKDSYLQGKRGPRQFYALKEVRVIRFLRDEPKVECVARKSDVEKDIEMNFTW